MARWRYPLAVLLALMFTMLGACLDQWFMNSRSDRVIKQWHQPGEVDYQSYDPYSLSVIEGAREWNFFSFSRRHYLFIGRGTNAPSYGHYLDYTFHPGSEEIDAHIGRSSVEWTQEGLTFVEETGHRLFVPKDMYIGGR